MLRHLTEEVHRVVSSPYPVSLKKLYDITSNTNDFIIQQWADSHPCQIEILASAVLQALQLWPFALEILKKLSLIRDFRDAVLLQQPLLLDGLLRKAFDAEDATERYFPICIALLTAPLPEGVPYPATMPEFFLRTLERAAKSPSAITIRPIYTLLSGSSDQDTKNLEDHSVNLLCLATFSTIIRAQKEASSPLSEVSSWMSSSIISNQASHFQFEPIQHFFTPKKALKIMQLVMLRVVYACSGSGNLTPPEAHESIKLATVIVDAVEPRVRDTWLSSNGPLARKLYEKILRPDMDPDLRVETLNFISSLLVERPILPEIVILFREILCEGVSGRSNSIILDRLSVNASHRFLTYMGEASVTEVLRKALSVATREDIPITESLNILKASESFISTLIDSIRESPDLRQNIIYAVATNEFSALLKDFLELPRAEKGGHCSANMSCPVTYANARRRLCLAISTLLLKTMLCSSVDNIGIEASLAFSLLEKQTDFIAPLPACKSNYISRTDSASESLQLVEQQSTPSGQRCSLDWRQRLSSDILKDAASRTEFIIQTMGEVCRDLEERCESVEQPLCVERARATELNLRITELESDAAERGQFLAGVELEKSHLEYQAQAAEVNIDKLSQRCQELEDQLQQACQRAKDSSISASAKAKRLELEHLASISGKDELLDELSDRVKHTEQGAADLRANLEGAISTIKLKDLEIREFHKIEEALKTNIGMLNNNLQENKQMTEEIEQKHKQDEMTLRRELEAVVGNLKTQLLELAEETTRKQLLHQHEILESDKQRQLIEESRNEDQQRFESKLAELEEKNARLRLEVKQKEKEFEEVQELSRRMVAVMGPNKSSANHQKGNNAPASKSSACNVSFGSSTSSQSGSTPKRTKTRKSPKTPAKNPIQAGRVIRTVKTAHNTRNGDFRIPLKEVGNGSCFQPSSLHHRESKALTIESKAASEVVVSDENRAEVGPIGTDDSSFNDSDLLTSTQKVPLHRNVNHANQDETTADF